MAVYLEKTNPAYLRKQFSEDKNKIGRIFYRRKVNNTYHKVMMEIIPNKGYCEEEPLVFIYIKDMEII